MQKYRYALLFSLLIATLPAIAQHQSYNSFHPTGTSSMPARMQHYMHSGITTHMEQRTAASEKLYAFVSYIFGVPPNQQKQDSFQFTYSGAHGSMFDYDGLYYNYFNTGDYPYPNSLFVRTGYVQFDSMVVYHPGSATPSNIMIRTYDPNFDKAASVEDFYNKYNSYLVYDPFGKLTKVIKVDTFGGASGFDTVSREYFFYNGSNYDIKDSTENWDGTKWAPTSTVDIITNPAGLPLRLNFNYPTPSGMKLGQQVNNTYNTLDQLISSVRLSSRVLTGPLVNETKDTFAYTTGMITRHDTYRWDSAGNAWAPFLREIRHLNPAALPDSIFTTTYQNGGVDSSIQTIAYTSKDNPVYQRYYSGDGSTLLYEWRFYYQQPILKVSGPAHAGMDISLYPNPANDLLHVTGIESGHFTILNTAGQPIASGPLSGHAGISVQSIPCGIYQLVVQDASGILHTARFVKE